MFKDYYTYEIHGQVVIHIKKKKHKLAYVFFFYVMI